MDAFFEKIRNEDAARSLDDHIDGCIFKVLFLKRSPLITAEVFPALLKHLKYPEFQQKIIDQHQKVHDLERQRLRTEASKCEAAGHDPLFYTAQLPRVEKMLAIDSLDSYLNFLRDPKEGHPTIIEFLATEYAYLNDGSDGMSYVTEHYPLYSIGCLLYERYKAKISVFERFDSPGASALSALYRKHGIDLEATDPQFRKYRLLSLSDDVSICNHKESQTIVDTRIGQYFWLHVPQELLAAIEAAIVSRWVADISFNVSAITDVLVALEGVEYGCVFSFQTLQLPSISKLYDEELYDNSLWIKVNTQPASMTFEELCDDFPLLDGMVVTQVVHLEFFVDQGQQFISHLDHEYILYTEEAYDRRRNDACVKGHKKQKTFKIDKARIPFDYSFEGRYFLYLVLDAYFKNKSLLIEYFSRVGLHPI